jgi:transposase
VHDRRGTKGMDAAGVLPEFTGIAVHDAWAPYDTYQAVTHALCGAHVLREPQAVTDLADADQWCWATQAGDALRELNHLVNDALAASNTLDIDPAALADAVDRYRSAALLGVQATRPRVSKLMGKHNALARRLLDRQDDYLRFTLDPRISRSTTTPAEPEIRMIKLRQKVSGCLRTLTGAHQFYAIRSYLATTAKHGIHFFAALTTLAEGRPWLPETA